MDDLRKIGCRHARRRYNTAKSAPCEAMQFSRLFPDFNVDLTAEDRFLSRDATPGWL
jgi:hypothetical protein